MRVVRNTPKNLTPENEALKRRMVKSLKNPSEFSPAQLRSALTELGGDPTSLPNDSTALARALARQIRDADEDGDVDDLKTVMTKHNLLK